MNALHEVLSTLLSNIHFLNDFFDRHSCFGENDRGTTSDEDTEVSEASVDASEIEFRTKFRTMANWLST